MKTLKLTILLAIILSLVMSMNLLANGEQKIQKTFARKNKVRLKLKLGSCEIKNSSDNKIHVVMVYSYENDLFEYRFKEKEKYLLLEEKLHGRNHGGYSRWTVAVPKGIKIDFTSENGDLSIEGSIEGIHGETGTGDIDITHAKGEFDLTSGTGSVEVIDSGGEFDLTSGIGKVVIKDSKGNFKAKSGTGGVEAYNLTIDDEADFKSGYGDVEVILPKGEDYDLFITSGTGDAILDMRGQPAVGYFEFKAHARKGYIISPVKFDKEEEYWGDKSKYLLKSFTRKKKSPRFFINTGTGKAKLKL